MKITTTTVPFLLVLAACASRPAPPSPFHAPALQEPTTPAESAGEADETALTDVAPLHASPQDSPISMDVRHITVLVGVRDVDNNGLEDLDIEKQGLLGIEMDSYDRKSGLGFEVGLSTSHADDHVAGQDVEARFSEIYGGLRETIPLDSPDIHPYVGFGATILHGDVDAGLADDDDTTLGAYIRAGINFTVGEKLRLGADLRHVFADLDMFGDDDFDADFDQFAVTASFPF